MSYCSVSDFGNLTLLVFHVSALLHEVLRNQEILMEQQRSIMRMVQDLQTNNDSEIADADADPLSQRHFPIEDLKALTELENELRSCPETRRKMVNIT